MSRSCDMEGGSVVDCQLLECCEHADEHPVCPFWEATWKKTGEMFLLYDEVDCGDLCW